VEFPKTQTSTGQYNLGTFNYELSEAYLSQALTGTLKKELVMYAILRDTKLYELKPEYQRLQGSPAQGKQIRFFLPQLIDRHHITVANLLKDIQSENPEIYLTLKTKLRSLGLYNEDFSLQSLI